MSGGSGQQQTVQSNAPPAQYLAAYSDVLGRAQNVASQPLQQYQGQLQADFSPLQTQAFGSIGSAGDIQAPYLNAAADKYAAATASLQPSMQPYVDQAQGLYGQSGNTDLSGAISPFQQQAMQGFASGSQALSPQQYSADALAQYENPYTDQVVDATQRQFDLQNAQAQTSLRGNAASKGALGGDRLGVAQAELAGQQQTAQAPVIAGLRNTGFQQAQQEFNNQQQTNLSADQQSRALAMQGAQGFAGLGSQALTAAQQQAALRNQAAQGLAGLGGQELSAAQGQGWLNSQAASGFAGLGNAALSGQLNAANAQLGAGALQQQQAQTGLNIPYQQFQAQQSYPFSTVGWLSNIAQGLGSSSGSSGSSTVTGAGPSALSQVGGLATGAIGTLGATGAFGSNGYLTGGGGGGSGGGAAIPYDTGAYVPATVAGDTFTARGGRIRGFANGGNVDDFGPLNVDAAMGETVPDASVSVVPEGGATVNAPGLIKRDWGKTTTSSGSGDSTLGGLLKAAGTIAAGIYGGPAGAMAANYLGSQTHFAPGGSVPVLPTGFGGADAIVNRVPDAQGFGVPQMRTGSAAPASGGGYTNADLDSYLAKQAAGAHRQAEAAPAAAQSAPSQDDINTLVARAMAQQQSKYAEDHYTPVPGEAWAMGNKRGGAIRGFAAGGDTDDALDFDPQRYLPPPQDPGPVDTGSSDSELHGGAFPSTPVSDAAIADRPLVSPKRTSSPAVASTSNLPIGGDGVDGPAPPAAPPSSSSSILTGLHRGISQEQVKPNGFDQAYSEALKSNRALKEDRANPWLALAEAGFASAAGTSPNALMNIGAGFSQGVKSYISADKAAKDLAARVDQTRAKLAETQAYHEATNETKNRGQDFATLDRQDRNDAQRQHYDMMNNAAMARIALAAERSANAASGGHGNWQFMGVDPETQKPILLDSHSGQMKLSDQAVGLKPKDQAMVDLGTRRADQGDDRLQLAHDRFTEQKSSHDQSVQAKANAAEDSAVKAIMYANPDAKYGDALKTVRSSRASAGNAEVPQAAPRVPSIPHGIPAGSQFSPSRNQWRDPNGVIYDSSGNPQ